MIPQGNSDQFSPVSLTLVSGGQLIFNARDWTGAHPNTNATGTTLAIIGFNAPLYVTEDLDTVMTTIAKAVGYDVHNVRELIRSKAA